MPASATALRFGIVADDLTGALDSAVAFCRPGYEVTVRLPGSTGTGPTTSSVLAVVSGARDVPWEQAEDLIHQATTAVLAANPDELLIKIDSQLRGYPGAQVAQALALATPSTIALVAPAFPRMGRTTVNGIQRIDSRPVSGSRRAREISVSDALYDGTVCFARLGLDELRTSMDLTTRLRAMQDAGIRIVIFDAETDDDLEHIVASGRRLAQVIWVGSGGLAAALAGPKGESPTISAPVPSREGRPSNILVLAGSAAPETAKQVSVLSRRRTPVITIAPTSDNIAEPDPVTKIRAALAEHHLATVSTDFTIDDRLHPSHAANLAAVVAEIATDVNGLVVSGGETMLNLMLALGVTELTVLGEVETGVPLSFSREPVSLAIVSKAGAFGDQRTLDRAVEFLATHMKGSNQ